MAEGTARDYAGTLEEYRALVLSDDDEPERGGIPKRQAGRKGERRTAAQARGRTQPLRDAVRKADAELARLAKRRGEIDQALLDPARYAGADGNIAALLKTRAELDRAIAAAEASWLKASEALEQAEAG